MKIINRAAFLTLPSGTLYSTYEPCIFGELYIKGDNVGSNDFYYQQIADAIECNDSGEFEDKLFDAQEHGTSIRMDFNCEDRDGRYDRLSNQNETKTLNERQTR